MRLSEAAGVTIRAPARLHLGFLDLGGTLGRRFGSLGIALERPVTEVTVRRAAADAASGPDADRAARARDAVRGALGIPDAFTVDVDAALPAHNGLGSGTQLAVSVGVAVARLSGHALSARTVATLLGRGRRSAIGMEAFEAGGVILDGGKALSGPEAAAPRPCSPACPCRNPGASCSSTTGPGKGFPAWPRHGRWRSCRRSRRRGPRISATACCSAPCPHWPVATPTASAP
ncbi:hypothetical protein EZH22_18280 [Xanthobacter dioxanivorans]|uniref:GHMP kinase N-terminal domain-containing protein n=1 Tax=Xanthobacter dioxanivorans TaxID=2528964 RepID=A0A974PK46_9HYPH|nr:hypothetical protein [Xanthobacter dioxanivorans]QRG05067.1 hypothetical protein EZH22_18280 [Xanthobacter dioxanivorans]